MAKVINEYTGFDANNIYTRASAIGDIVEGSTSVSTTNITMSDIRNVLSQSTNALGALHNSAANNKYSAFGAYEHYVTTSKTLGYRFKNPRSMGNFACYDDAATAPSASITTKNISWWEGDKPATFSGYSILQTGQVDWHGLTGWKIMKADYFDEAGTLIHSEVKSDYSAGYVSRTSRNIQHTFPAGNLFTPDASKVYTIKHYIANSVGDLVVTVANTINWTINITVKSIKITELVSGNSCSSGEGQLTNFSISYDTNTKDSIYSFDAVTMHGTPNCSGSGSYPNDGAFNSSGQYTGDIQVQFYHVADGGTPDSKIVVNRIRMTNGYLDNNGNGYGGSLTGWDFDYNDTLQHTFVLYM